MVTRGKEEWCNMALNREGKGDERDLQNTEKEGGENRNGKVKEEKRLYTSEKTKRNTFLSYFSFLFSLGCHSNKAMDTEMQSTAK